jgi:uncharacterized protein YaaQ
MKLIIAIIHDEDNDRVSRMLTGENFRVTMVASTGGFLRSGRSTLLIGVEDERLERALQLLRENCVTDKEGKEKKAIVFVLNVEEFIQA